MESNSPVDTPQLRSSALTFVAGLLFVVIIFFCNLPQEWLVPAWILMVVSWNKRWQTVIRFVAAILLVAAVLVAPCLLTENPSPQFLIDWVPRWLAVGLCRFFVYRYQRDTETQGTSGETDDLTGLLRRNSFLQGLQRQLTQSMTNRKPFTLVFIDCDDFKRRNDESGHATGDALLKQLAHALLSGIRNCDLAGRYGGDEFLLMLANVDEDRAIGVVSRLRAQITEHTSRSGEPLTVSVGLLGVHQFDAAPETLIHMSDRLMYRAKGQSDSTPVRGRYPDRE